MKTPRQAVDKSLEAVHIFREALQGWLFPSLEAELGALDEKHRAFVDLCAALHEHFPAARYEWCGNGKPPESRWSYFKALLAKAFWNFPSTTALIGELAARPVLRRLCGFEDPGDVPSEGNFSKVFGAFADDGTAQYVFARFIAHAFEGALIHHLLIDSAAVHAREKAAVKDPSSPTQESRLAVQPSRSADENFRDLPAQCDVGVKRNSKGFKESWRGYKLHVAASDGDIPVAMCLTSASLHDSQAAIPLMQKAAEVCPALYDLMDTAYDAAPIRDYSRSIGSVPIIPVNPRRSQDGAPELEPDRAERFKNRSGIERVNSHLEDGHGGRSIYVRGHAKVFLHLAFGILVIAVEQVFKLLE